MDEVSVEMVKPNGLVGIKWLARLFNVCSQQEIPADWRRGSSVQIWQGKGDIHDSRAAHSGREWQVIAIDGDESWRGRNRL